MPAAKLRPVRTEHDNAAACHVLAAVVADALHHRVGAGVAHGEALAGQPAEEGPPDVAPYRTVLPTITCSSATKPPRRAGARDHAAGKTLAGVVVGVAVEREGDARRQPGAEALTGRASSAKRTVLGRQARRAAGARDVAREMPPTLRLTLRTGSLTSTGPALERRLCASRPASNPARHRAPAAAAGCAGVACPRAARRVARACERSTPRAFQCSIASSAVEQVDATDRILEASESQRGQDLARLLGDEEEEVDDVLRRALESLAKLGILCRDPDRARVQVTGPHHDAASGDQRRGREAHLVGAQQRSDHTSRPVLSCPSV